MSPRKVAKKKAHSFPRMQIGDYALSSPVVLAPMAGVTDAAFRRVCLSAGAALAFGEMVESNPQLRTTEKTERRFHVSATEAVPVVQILGADPERMAEAAHYAELCGAKIVDVNFGCPARLVCGKAAGSALMADVALAVKILEAVKGAVSIPVTVKMRTGWDARHKTAEEIALAAEESGFAAVTIHGRTREAKFTGPVDYETIARVAGVLKIPVIANGDIDSGEKARRVLQLTGASGVMIGRAALGAPWIFREVSSALTQEAEESVTQEQKHEMILLHWREHLKEFGTGLNAVRTFRKHLVRYLAPLAGGKEALQEILALQDAEGVGKAIKTFLESEQTWIT